MFPGLDPKKIQAVMKQIGMSQDEIPTKRVIIEKQNNSKIIIKKPSVVKIKIQGQESFQISGDVSEEESFSEEDLKTIMEKTNCSEEDARNALKETEDLADAIIKLSR